MEPSTSCFNFVVSWLEVYISTTTKTTIGTLHTVVFSCQQRRQLAVKEPSAVSLDGKVPHKGGRKIEEKLKRICDMWFQDGAIHHPPLFLLHKGANVQ